MISPEDKARIHAAMEAAEGNRALAADALGITRDQLKVIIHNHPDLKTRWASTAKLTSPPSEAITIHRPIVLPSDSRLVPLATDEEVAAAVERQDSMVRNGLEAAGVKGAALDMAIELQKLHRSHFQSLLEMLGGGANKLALDFLVEIGRITEELNDKFTPIKPERDLVLRQDRIQLGDLYTKLYDRGLQAVLTRAKVKLMQKQAEGGGKGNRPSKPGFAPLVAVRAEGNVTIHETKQ